MAERNDGAGSRQDPRIRHGALLLSSLVLSPDSALERYREQRAGDRGLDVEQLRRARDVLDAIGFAISADEPERWTRLEQAWRLLRDDAHRLPRPLDDNRPSAPRTAEDRRAAASPPERAAPPDANDRPHPSHPFEQGALPASDLDETAAMAPLAAIAAPLPFRGRAAIPPPAAPPCPEQPGSDLDETAAVAPLGEIGPALPFAGSRSAAIPTFTLEQFASLRAELAARPAAESEILTRYGLAGEAALIALQQRWELRLQADPSMRKSFEELLARYRQWLTGRHG
jgi:hypothetical protein